MLRNDNFPKCNYLLFLIGVVCFYAITTSNAAASCVSLTRTVTTAVYTPGQEVVVELKLQNNCTEELASLGIVESFPTGWAFLGGETVSGADPVQWLAPDSTDTLELYWITVPVFPVVLRYTLQVPEEETIQAVFTGHAVYSFTTGGQQNSSIAETILAPTSLPEGEDGSVEGETTEGEIPVEGESIAIEEGESEAEAPVEGEIPQEGEVIDEGEGEEENTTTTGCCRRQSNKTATFAGDGLLFACGLLLFIFPCRKKSSP